MARTRNVQEIKRVARRIRSVDKVNPYVKVLVYGPNGSGKTRFAATAPDVLIIDINEEGTRSAVGSGARVLEVRSWEDLGHAYWYLKSGKHKYKSVAVDTLTAMNNLAISFVKGQKSGDPDPTEERTRMSKQDYGRVAELMRGMILAFRNLDMHVIFTAQVRTIRDEDTGEVVEYAVNLPAGSRGVASDSVSVVGFMKPRETVVKKGGKRKRVWVDHMLLGPHEQYPSLKDRTYQLGRIVRRPSMVQVIEAWETRRNNKED